MKKMILASLSFFALTACGPADSDPGSGGVSVEDARTLDEAAEKLDAETKPDRDTAARQ